MTSATLFKEDALLGKRILITGGGTGLGRGVARHLAAHGAELHLWGRRANVLDDAAPTVNRLHPGHAFTQMVDIRDGELVDAAVQRIWDQQGPLTGLINNAAANFIAETAELSPRGFRAVTSTVMDGSFHTTHACGRRWIAQGIRGAVVSRLTSWIWTGSAFVTPSAMAKAAVHAMTMSLAVLLSDACDYLTGHTIAMDGAQHLAGPGTFAGLTGLTTEDWAQAREKSKRATAAAKEQRFG